MPRLHGAPPLRHAKLLASRIARHGARCWLLNTGWTGGPFGIGRRISICHTRALLNVALSGALQQVKYRTDPISGFDVPSACEGLPLEVLEPANNWSNREEYCRKYDALAARFIDNFKLLEAGCPEDVVESGPKQLSGAGEGVAPGRRRRARAPCTGPRLARAAITPTQRRTAEAASLSRV